jgi:FMN phosphatase YigB (HAD superfamily)
MRMEGAETPDRLPRDLKAVIFDVDGTLYRLRELKRAVQIHFIRGNWRRPLEAWRVHRAVTAYRHAVEELRASRPVGVELSERHLECASKSARLSKEYIRDCVDRLMMQEPLAFLPRFRHEGVQEVLQEMSEAGLRLGIFSDLPAATKLRALGIEGFFEAVISAQDSEVQRFKPHPRGLLLVLERMGISAGQALYVGDRPEIDGLAARRAGMAFFAAGDGHPVPERSFQRLRELVLGPKER